MDNITIEGVFIKWLGNAGFMIKGDGMVIYIDPANIREKVPEADMADLLLITHEYLGHCDPDSIRKVRKSDCTTLIPEDMSLQFRGDARRIMAGDSLTGELSIKGVDIEVVPSYESCDDTTSLGHGVGYFLSFAGLNIYHAGHTCNAAELSSASLDIALLPIGGNGAMEEEQAANAVALLNPKFVIPIYESNAGVKIDNFVSMVREKSPSVKVVIL
ncbi:MBL fold metallo-hydrolase [Methanolobus sp.]|uniref:MBL fold metallo-hydrolase n=1 Tax=Methanolobus sp. TaxID=1874737 RepID=UPI0025ED92AB|nr:MBL fold metallo-hydrolase [Methanolobus sp.]